VRELVALTRAHGPWGARERGSRWAFFAEGVAALVMIVLVMMV